MKRFSKASFTGVVINGSTYVTWFAMFVADKPEERTVLCLKRQDSDMDCTDCVLQSRVRSSQQSRTSMLQSSSSDESGNRTAIRRISIRNTDAQMSIARHPERDPTLTVRHQLRVASHHMHHNMDNVQLASSRRHLIAFSAHEFPPALSSFAGLGSTPCNLYRIVSFDKLHVVNMGITRQFCDLMHGVLQEASSLPLSRIMSIANERFLSLPRSAHLSSHLPFQTTQQGSQAGISGKIRRESVPFLWVCLMGLSNCEPDSDRLMQCALQLDYIISMLCTRFSWTEMDI